MVFEVVFCNDYTCSKEQSCYAYGWLINWIRGTCILKMKLPVISQRDAVVFTCFLEMISVFFNYNYIKSRAPFFKLKEVRVSVCWKKMRISSGSIQLLKFRCCIFYYIFWRWTIWHVLNKNEVYFERKW